MYFVVPEPGTLLDFLNNFKSFILVFFDKCCSCAPVVFALSLIVISGVVGWIFSLMRESY